jgi:hypothetical protein
VPPTNLTFREPLQTAARHALAHIENLDALPVAATASLEMLRARLARSLADDGALPAQVIDDLVSDSAGGIAASAGGRVYSWMVGGSVPAALAADWLASAWDQNAGLYAARPAAALVEEIAGEWLKELLGIPAGASFAFVTGCQMAHVACLAAARHAVLERWGWDVEAMCSAGKRVPRRRAIPVRGSRAAAPRDCQRAAEIHSIPRDTARIPGEQAAVRKRATGQRERRPHREIDARRAVCSNLPLAISRCPSISTDGDSGI